ncbi:histone deacetylase [Tilletia horrida]|uniref:Histone deacetylase n=1 Tax=Tilletia horrida TaxID=155126 RepID=A0AAN6GVH7_9BASI|nr:histone deacetylase [Tilletia horrida]
MPLIVKLKRPGGSPAAAPAADVDGTPTSVFGPPPSLLAPSLAAASPAAIGHDEDEMAMEDEEADDGGNRTPTDQDLHIKLEPQQPPQTPDFNRMQTTESIKSPVDTAMHDSTPIMEQAPQSIFAAAAGATQAQNLLSVTPPAAAVDVIIAPACLQHRYVRSYDISTIVERPERLRAVILGISAAVGRAHTASSLNNAPFVQQPRSGTVDALQQGGRNHDDLANRLQEMSLSRALASSNPVNVWLSTRSLDLHPPHPAVSYVHAHPEEGVAPISPDFAASRNLPFATDLLQQSAQTVKVEVLTKQEAGAIEAPATEIKGVTFSSYLAELCRLAPSGPPERLSDDPDRTLPGPHPSEVPTEYPQGDLYLKGHQGPESGGAEAGGSGEAIRHALGACAEAVDRVVAAVISPTSPLPASSPQNLTHLHLPLDPFLALPDAQTPVPGPSRRNFVLTRPPGHHCSGNQPSGFCWTSNAVVAAAHAYIEHGIDRVVILDIDLHHGNGTQSLAWRINQETLASDIQRDARIAAYQQALASSHSPKANRTSHHHGGHRKSPSKTSASAHNDAPLTAETTGLQPAQPPSTAASAGSSPPAPLLPPDLPPRGLKIFYGSLHDIESYPCETGDPELVRDASTCIEGSHGQWIWNVHLDSYANEAEFEQLYTAKYSALFTQARRFARSTSSDPARTLVLISAGFDACTHEYSTMSRHGRSVPVSFYSRFANDSVALAEEIAGGKVVSILEGGYSDRALSSAAMALVSGLAGYVPSPISAGNGGGCEEWWEVESLLKLEKAAKKAAENGLVGLGGSASVANSANTTPNTSVVMTATASGGGRRRAAAPSASNPAWLQSAMSVYATLERAARIRPDGSFDTFDSNPANCGIGGGNAGTATGSGRVLRDRTKGRAVSGPVGAAALTSTPIHGGASAASMGPSSVTGTPVPPIKVKKEPI